MLYIPKTESWQEKDGRGGISLSYWAGREDRDNLKFDEVLIATKIIAYIIKLIALWFLYFILYYMSFWIIDLILNPNYLNIRLY